jgi:hypothetical protein
VLSARRSAINRCPSGVQTYSQPLEKFYSLIKFVLRTIE